MPETGMLHLSDSGDDGSFSSPIDISHFEHEAKTSPESSGTPQPRNNGSNLNAEQTREVLLQRELESVRKINKVIENVTSSLQRAKDNMDTVSGTVNSASTLLNTWIRILSQTEHNQRLIVNPNWKGASADLVDAENESIQKAQAHERRLAEEERKREEDKKRVEDEERQRQAGSSIQGLRGSSSRSRGTRGGLGTSSSRLAGGSSVIQSVGRGSQRGRIGTVTKRGLGASRGRDKDAR